MTVDYEGEELVVVVTIDRPGRRNAVDRGTAEALLDAWTRCEEGRGGRRPYRERRRRIRGRGPGGDGPGGRAGSRGSHARA